MDTFPSMGCIMNGLDLKRICIGFAFMLFAFSSNAQAANMSGSVCTTLGATTMADDKTTIIACMLQTGNSAATTCANGGGCVWKSMVGGSKFGTYQSVGLTGTAPTDGFLVVRSSYNGGIQVFIDGVAVTQIHCRDKYGQGYVSATTPILRGATWKINGYNRGTPEVVRFIGMD